MNPSTASPLPAVQASNPAEQIARAGRREAGLRVILPLALIALLLVAWEAIVRINQIPHYILPAPTLVLRTLFEQWHSLAPSLWFTVKLTLMALAAAVVGGVLLAMAFALSKWVEIGLFPLAVVMQVTPIVAIAPLILIYVDNTMAALLICAWIVAFFPILSNTVIGLKSADSNLRDLFGLYRASPWQLFRFLLVPSALPYFLGGLKIAGGLALIGAVVAEFTAGSAGRNTGLASRILESMFRTEIPMMFAALLLVSLLGIVIFVAFAALAKLMIGHWHESEMRRES
ncbi:MAG: ABC transporter permease [Ramlibacter sp.]|jgi:NitT/TauT family transport system permease protein|uniref:ABC transporter permease n=1 Tax=Ramlibacter sp. TaxID=1917967 RepID=UPI002633AC9B|nr:ABC transporter permease [Ramlibacter sp.]MDH4376581.1 ABC transporter permease [Ramlibacter sp.]